MINNQIKSRMTMMTIRMRTMRTRNMNSIMKFKIREKQVMFRQGFQMTKLTINKYAFNSNNYLCQKIIIVKRESSILMIIFFYLRIKFNRYVVAQNVSE